MDKKDMNLEDKYFNNKRILVTGGAGFIGSNLIRRLIKLDNSKIFNLDKVGYSSDFEYLKNLETFNSETFNKKYTFIKADLNDFSETNKAIKLSNPDFIFHLAAESHVDRSIDSPKEFIQSNIIGTFNLLENSLNHFKRMTNLRKNNFKFLHISTDEVFGSLGEKGLFDEKSRYDPRSPYSATKASSDHLVRAWKHTYNFPTLITNCSNNFGPWQFPEKLIPLIIIKALNEEEIPIYGNGKNIRDWLFVEDHVDALLTVIKKGEIGDTYCIGSNNEKTNIEIAERICLIIDKIIPLKYPRYKLIKYVPDRPGHDKRYAIDNSLIKSKLGWEANYDFDSSLEKTVVWYMENEDWCQKIIKKSNYKFERIGNSVN